MKTKINISDYVRRPCSRCGGDLPLNSISCSKCGIAPAYKIDWDGLKSALEAYFRRMDQPRIIFDQKIREWLSGVPEMGDFIVTQATLHLLDYAIQGVIPELSRQVKDLLTRHPRIHEDLMEMLNALNIVLEGVQKARRRLRMQNGRNLLETLASTYRNYYDSHTQGMGYLKGGKQYPGVETDQKNLQQTLDRIKIVTEKVAEAKGKYLQQHQDFTERFEQEFSPAEQKEMERSRDEWDAIGEAFADISRFTIQSGGRW